MWGSRRRRGGAKEGGQCLKPRIFKVLVAEKPKAAEKIAQALSTGRLVKCRVMGVPYWIVPRDGEILVVAPSAGHLFTPASDRPGFPVFDLVWKPIFEVEKGSSHLRKFYYMLSKVVPGAVLYVNACDYDVEGSVIGYKIIEAFGDVKRARRMKFSSLSKTEILQAYRRLERLDLEMVEAGLARNEMDWLWGINISRALMEAARRVTGRRISLSAGRVQSPTLVEAARRWVERNTYLPLPEIRLTAILTAGSVEFQAHPYRWKVESIDDALRIKEELKGSTMTVVSVEEKEEVRKPPPPFNLGDLQAEASRIYGYSPMETQSIAEDLYTEALISYPRTNSQKLPPTLDYKGLVNTLLRGPHSSLARELLRESGGILRPTQGRKDDPAHPAIHPIDVPRSPLKDKYWKIYDLVVRRFLAAFSKPARIVHINITLKDVKGRLWLASGEAVVYEGWLKYYHFARPREREVPRLKRGLPVPVLRVSYRVEWVGSSIKLDKMSLLKWMETVGIGTESTRARIIEKLFSRKYLRGEGRKVVVTDLGLTVAEIIALLFPDLSNPSLTREFEKMLDDIRFGRSSREEALRETRSKIAELLRKFNEKLPSVERKLAYVLGAEEPPVKCIICGREASLSLGGYELCKLHAKAACQVAEKIGIVSKRLGTSETEALKAIAGGKGGSGVWVQEVAALALKAPSFRRALTKAEASCRTL